MSAPLSEQPEPEVGTREWLEALPFAERLGVTAVWAKYVETTAGFSGDVHTLAHLKWAVAQTQRLTARVAELEAERDAVTEFGIRIPAPAWSPDAQVLLDGNTFDRAEQEARLERYRDCWPHAELVARTVTRGAWTDAQAGEPA